MMKNTKIIILVLMGLTLIAGNAVFVLAQEKITMKFADYWKTDDGAYNKGLNFVKPRIEQLTNGRVKVELHLGTLGAEREMYEMLRIGTIHAAILTTGPLGSFVPLAEIFNVPFLFESQDHLNATTQGPLGDHLTELALNKGMRVLGWWVSGGRQIYGNGKPIPVHPKDLKGKKVRVMETPIHIETYRHYGALPTPMSGAEVYTGLQQRVVDAAQSALAMISASWNEVCEWCVMLDEQYTVAPFWVSEQWWAKLPEDVKRAIKQAVREGTTINHALSAIEDVDLRKRWTKTTKVVDSDRPAYKAKARELYPRFGALLGSEGNEWLNWVTEVGKAFPIEEYPTIKKYGGKYAY